MGSGATTYYTLNRAGPCRERPDDSVNRPLVQARFGDTLEVDLRGWVRQYVRLLVEAEGVKVASTTPPSVQEASNDR